MLATELKNNSFKLARWTAQATIAGCDVIKFGYITRKMPTDASARMRLLKSKDTRLIEIAHQKGNDT